MLKVKKRKRNYSNSSFFFFMSKLTGDFIKSPEYNQIVKSKTLCK